MRCFLVSCCALTLTTAAVVAEDRPEIKLWPPMLSRLPLLPIRITVTVLE